MPIGKTRSYWKYRESDSADSFQPGDEASYYLGDKFEMGGVEFSPPSGSSEKSFDFFRHEIWNEQDFLGKGPRGYKRSDERVYADVCDALMEDPHLDPSDIEVLVKDGCVYLRGTVASRLDKKDAQDCIEHVRGVLDVMNELHIRKV